MTTEPQTNDSENAPSSSEESLEQLEQHAADTAAIMADARQKVDRARATLHDEILSTMQGSAVTDTESESESEPEAGEVDSEARESGPDKDDTRGAWPNWS